MSDDKSKKFTFGQVLKQARKAKGVTCEELADAIESTVGHISDLEHDRIGIPRFSIIERLEAVLEITDGRLRALYNPANPYQEKDRFISTVYYPDGRRVQLSTDLEDESLHKKLRRLNIAIRAIMVDGKPEEVLLEAWDYEKPHDIGVYEKHLIEERAKG